MEILHSVGLALLFDEGHGVFYSSNVGRCRFIFEPPKGKSISTLAVGMTIDARWPGSLGQRTLLMDRAAVRWRENEYLVDMQIIQSARADVYDFSEF